MDPTANLEQQEWTLNQIAVCKGPNRRRNLETDLTELRQALYDWIRDGGFEPDWSKAPKASPYFIGNRQENIMAKREKAAKILRTGRKVEAENKSDSQAENACVPEGNQGNSILSDPPFINEEKRTVATITLKFKGTQKNGIHTFSDESRGASVYVNKSLFAEGKRPDELTIEAPTGVFAEPGSSRAAARGASPEKAAKAEEAAKKAAERATKAQEREKKAQEKLDRIRKALGTPAEQPSA